jgi:hypothetical protein
LCALAVPAFAAPTVQIVPGGTHANGHLNAAGDWVYNVTITPDLALVPDASGTPLAGELGFTETTAAELLSAVQGADFDTANPGKVIFGWETISDTDGTPGIGPNDEPVGVQTNLTTDQVFAALGSANFTTAGGKLFTTIVIDGPRTSGGSLNTALSLSGGYGGNGRVAQITGGTAPNYTTGNFDTFAGSVSRTAQEGDADLNGTTNFFDLQALLGKYNQAGAWYEGDFTGDGTVNFFDLQALLGKYNQSYTVVTDGAIPGGGAGGAVPEPTSAVLMLVGSLFCLVRRR